MREDVRSDRCVMIGLWAMVVRCIGRGMWTVIQAGADGLVLNQLILQ